MAIVLVEDDVEIATTLRELERRGSVRMFEAPFVSVRPVAKPVDVPAEARDDDAGVDAEAARAGGAGAGTDESVSEEGSG